MPPKDAGKKGKPGKGKDPGQSSEPIPSLVITSEELPTKNWWPTIHLVVENSPVESLLVELMAGSLDGNSVVIIQKHELLREMEHLLRTHQNTVLHAQISRREKEKIAKKQAEDELVRKKEAEEKEKEAERQRQEPQEKAAPGKASTALLKQSRIAVRNSTEKAGMKQEPSPPHTEAPVQRSRTLLDDLFDELNHFNKDVPLEQAIRNPSVHCLTLMIKYKLMLLKQLDLSLFKTVNPDHIKVETALKTPEPTSTDHKKGKNKEVPPSKALATDAKSKAPATEKASALPKDPKAATSLPKGKPAGVKGKGQTEEASDTHEPPTLHEGERIAEPLYMESVKFPDPNQKSRARARSPIPDDMVPILVKLKNVEKEDEQKDDDQEVEPQLHGVRSHDAADNVATEIQFLQQLYQCSAFGTEGLPNLEHSVSLAFANYGIPSFPASKYQMVRYIILFGIQDTLFLREAERQKLPIASVVNVQLLRHRHLPLLKTGDLTWINQRGEFYKHLEVFWQETRSFVQERLSKPEGGLAGLVLVVKHNIIPNSTLHELQAVAAAAGSLLTELLYCMVRAKLLFQIYNQSLELQHIPKCKAEPHYDLGHLDGTNNICEFLTKLQAKSLERKIKKTDQDMDIVSESTVDRFLKSFREALCETGIISEKPDLKISSFPDIRTAKASAVLTKVADVILNISGSHETDFLRPALAKALNKLLKKQLVAVQYNRRWIEQLLKNLQRNYRHNKTMQNEAVTNPLADSMKTWNVGAVKLKKFLNLQEEAWKFIAPSYQKEGEEECPVSEHADTDDKLKKLLELRDCFAVISYTQNQLFAELANASEQYFHHCVRKDPLTVKTFVIFYALSNGPLPTHVRTSQTRLHCRADFPTFCCNIMDEIQADTEKHMNQTFRCPRQFLINQRFPYGCQNHLAFGPNCAENLGTELSDHMANFERRHCLKRFFRLNKETSAKLHGWKLEPSVAEEKLQLVIPVAADSRSPTPEPVKTTPEPKGKEAKSKKAPAAAQKHPEPEKLTPCPAREKSVEEEPFIWNREVVPPLPLCVSAKHQQIPAYHLSNSLTKIKREERRIYCCDAVILVDRHEFHDGKSAVYVSANMATALNAFCSVTEKERSLHLEYENESRFVFRMVNGRVQIAVFDPLGTETVIENNDDWFCEIRPSSGQPDSLASITVFNDGVVGAVGKGDSLLISASGSVVHVPDCQGEESDPVKTPDRKGAKVFRSSTEHTKILIHEDGTVHVHEKSRLSEEMRTQTRFGLRVTSSRTAVDGSADTVLHVFEYPKCPRVYYENFRHKTCSFCHGVLLSTTDDGLYVILMGVNVVIVEPDGGVFLTSLPHICREFDIQGVPGLTGYASKEQMAFINDVLTICRIRLDWLDKCPLVKLWCAGDIIAEVTDLTMTKHMVYENGEVQYQPYPEAFEGNGLPAPRIFVVDQTNQSGSEYLLGDDATALKYKVVHCYSANRIRIPEDFEGDKKEVFKCEVLEDARGEWDYEVPNVLPLEWQSDVNASAGVDMECCMGIKFRQRVLDENEQRDKWKNVLFVPN